MPSRTTIPKPKQAALRAIKEMKETASYADMMHELYVLEKIERGRADIRAGRTVSHTEARERLKKWIQ